jgi:ferredoxin
MTATAGVAEQPAIRVDHALLPALRAYGAFDIEACFNCGNCTAVCPLSSETETFPRRMIRYAQVGLGEPLKASPELWLCYHCGECSDTCPRQAEPAEFMAATRRWAIASYDRTGLARLLFTMPVLGTVLAIFLAAFLALFMYGQHQPMDAQRLALFEFIPAGVVHNVGVVVLILVALAGLAGVATMVTTVARGGGARPGGGSSREPVGADRPGRGVGIRSWAVAAWDAVARESLAQIRYRRECAAVQTPEPWYLRRWFVHASVVWGFLGLLAATIIDYGLDIAGLKPTGTAVPLWYPVRLLGTLAGLLLLYGTTVLIVRRLRRSGQAARRSLPSDWIFLVLLWLSGLSGFAIEVALYWPAAPTWGYWVFLFHVAIAMELVLLAPFTKFAHAVYRPVALAVHARRGLRKRAD